MPKAAKPCRIHVRSTVRDRRQLHELGALYGLNEGDVISRLLDAAWRQEIRRQNEADPSSPTHVLRPKQTAGITHTLEEMADALGVEPAELRRQLDPARFGTPKLRRAAGLVYSLESNGSFYFELAAYEQNVAVWECVHVAGGHDYNYNHQPHKCRICEHVVVSGGEVG